jgi:acetyl-CoA C-acetyltransferase
MTVSRVCGSGLQAVMLAAQAIRAGDAQVMLAGGMESMSNAPYYLFGYREGVKFGNQELVDGLIHDGLWCSFESCHMGGHAEYTAYKAASRGRTPTSSRTTRTARRRGHGWRRVPRGDRAGRDREPEGRDGRRHGRAAARDTTAETLAKLKPAFTQYKPPRSRIRS